MAPTIIGYAYNADFHCPDCAEETFPPCDDHGEPACDRCCADSECNPIKVIFDTDERDENGLYCADCKREIYPPADPGLDEADTPVPCPACGCTEVAWASPLGSLVWRRCAACGLDFAHHAA